MYNQKKLFKHPKKFCSLLQKQCIQFFTFYKKSKAVTESRICLPIYLKIGVNIKIASIGAKLHSCLRLTSICFDNIFNPFCFQIAHVHITKFYFSFQKGINNNNNSFIYSR